MKGFAMGARLQQLRRDERGMSLVYISLGFMGFLAATTLAIDVGMFMAARSQAQNSADAGALAGAVALAFNDFDNRAASGPAVQSAINAAQANDVMGAEPSIGPGDVTFPNDPSGRPTRVHVSVYRTQERNNAIPTMMGPLFGVNTVNIGATATAEASPANAMTCVKPFMIPDRWHEATGSFDPLTSTFDMYDNHNNLLPPDSRDTYVGPSGDNPTGYNSGDKGMELILRAGTGNNIEPTMYYSWKMPGDIGADYYTNNISGCNTTLISLSADDPFYMTQEPGNMVGPTNDGIDGLIAKDPGAQWDTGCSCIVNSAYGISPRVTPLPLYDPVYYATGKANGRNADFKLANIMGFFIERREGNQVYGRITPISGIMSPNAGPAPAGAFPVSIRLVE
jgi:Flp pilus assembly protein TadG